MPVQGLNRLRKHQFGRQAAFGTKVAATRAYPYSGVPSVDRQWTDPEVDTGTTFPTAAPFTGPGDFTADLTFPALTYNDLTQIMCGFFGGNVSPVPSGAAFVWTHKPTVTAPDDMDVFTYEFGDDVVTDWYQLGDGIIESFEITGPEGLGVCSASATWRFGSFSSTGATDFPVDGVVPTPGLSVATDDALVYLKDMGIYIADALAGIAAGQITDALHTFTLRGSREIDQKRWANADQSFDVDAFASGAVNIELEATYAKTTDTVGLGSESDDWMSETAVNRFGRLLFTSPVIADGGVLPYSWRATMPMRYYTRTEGEVGGNTVVILNAHAFYEADTFTGAFESVLTNTLDEATLGLAGS